MRLVGYVRLSTVEKSDGNRLDNQKAQVRRAAARHGHRIVRWCEDDGLSGALPVDKRPGIDCALSHVRTGDADGIIVRDLDRLARAVTVQEAILAEVWRWNGVMYTSTSEVPKDDPDDPMRTAMREMMAVFAGLERRMIAKRMRDGRKAKAAKGGHAEGRVGYGWRTDPDDPLGRLAKVEAEQFVIARMKAMRAEGMSLREIAAALTDDGVPAQRGGTWQANTISRILAKNADAVSAAEAR
jgi:DNA invertase Pin-like site-specific DNA recombinase